MKRFFFIVDVIVTLFKARGSYKINNLIVIPAKKAGVLFISRFCHHTTHAFRGEADVAGK